MSQTISQRSTLRRARSLDTLKRRLAIVIVAVAMVAFWTWIVAGALT